MKKKILTIVAIACMAFFAPVSAFADGEPEQVDLEVTIVDPSTQKGGIGRSPIQIPTVFLDGHTLYFDTPCDGCTLQLVDEFDSVVYSVTIPAGTTEWELPEAVTGEFVLQIIRGRYCFWGWIEL
ncbi:MAG: hypothetical protein IKS94_03870 [Prevotella sp.]|nr:hypothetical protein [Prevotella sp.]